MVGYKRHTLNTRFGDVYIIISLLEPWKTLYCLKHCSICNIVDGHPFLQFNRDSIGIYTQMILKSFEINGGKF